MMRTSWIIIPALLALAPLPAAAAEGHGDQTFAVLQVDELEHRVQDGADAVAWRAAGWYGGDMERALLKTEGEWRPDGDEVEEAEFQLLYSRFLSEFWNLEAGIRHDVRPRPQTTHAVLGVAGLAPLFIETEAALFLSDRGDLTARIHGELELPITQRLTLLPEAELNLSAQGVEALELGAGLTDLELGLRLSYALAPEFQPYLGVHWTRALGRTADLTRAAGEEAGEFALVLGLAFWI